MLINTEWCQPWGTAQRGNGTLLANARCGELAAELQTEWDESTRHCACLESIANCAKVACVRRGQRRCVASIMVSAARVQLGESFSCLGRDS